MLEARQQQLEQHKEHLQREQELIQQLLERDQKSQAVAEAASKLLQEAERKEELLTALREENVALREQYKLAIQEQGDRFGEVKAMIEPLTVGSRRHSVVPGTRADPDRLLDLPRSAGKERRAPEAAGGVAEGPDRAAPGAQGPPERGGGAARGGGEEGRGEAHLRPCWLHVAAIDPWLCPKCCRRPRR